MVLRDHTAREITINRVQSDLGTIWVRYTISGVSAQFEQTVHDLLPHNDAAELQAAILLVNPELHKPQPKGKLKQVALFDDAAVDDWGDSPALRKQNAGMKRLL